MADPSPSSQTAMYTASEVEARTGVPATTLRQWERRYGFPSPVRNASGYRLYSPEDVAQIQRMQLHLHQGVAAGRAAELTLQDAQPWQPSEPPQPTGAPDLSAALTEALIQSDEARAGALLAEAHALMPQEDVLLRVVSPTLVEIGLRWERGEITVAHEHQATTFLRARLTALMDAAGTLEGIGPLVVAACAPGEQHELGLMMLTLALRRRGLRVAYLGANMPLGDLAIYARERGARAVVLTLQGEWALDQTRAQLRDLDDLEVPVYYGGLLLNTQPELASELRGLYAGPDAPSAAQTIIRDLQAARGERP